MRNDEHLVEVFQQVADGTGNKRELCDLVEDQIFGLVLPVVKNEKRSDAVTGRILIELCESADTFNTERNLRRQIAGFTSMYLYEMLLAEGAQLQTDGDMVEYDYSMIKEDEELHEEMKKIVAVFRHPELYHKTDMTFKVLEPMEIVLLQLYGYETYTIDQLEDMLEMDSTFICNAIQRARCSLLGITLEEYLPYEENYYANSDEDFDGEGVIGFEEYDEDNEDEQDNQTVRDRMTSNDGETRGIIPMLFPNLDRKTVMGIRGGVAAVFFGCFIFLAVSLIHDKPTVQDTGGRATQNGTMATTKATQNNNNNTTQTTKSQDNGNATNGNNSATTGNVPTAGGPNAIRPTNADNENNTDDEEGGSGDNSDNGSEDVTEPSTEGNTEESTEEPTDGSTEASTEESTEDNTEETPEESTDGSTEAPSEEGTETPTESGSDENTENPTEAPIAESL